MYSKDSFNRFGDDLVRLLLSYHSFDDKYSTIQKRCLHECVSKQFQRVIFDPINEIYFQDLDFPHSKNTDPLIEEFCHKLVTFVQKKCPNIQSVHFDHNYLHKPSPNMGPLYEAIDELRNSWPHLKSVDFGYNEICCDTQIDHQILQHLFTTFAPMITQFMATNENLLPYLTDYHNLSHIWTLGFQSMFTTEEDNEIKAFNQLKELRFEWSAVDFNGTRLHRLQVFTDYYKTRLRCLEVSSLDTNIVPKSMVTQFLTQLIEFQELRELGLRFKEALFERSIDGYLQTIGIKCAKLKKFSLEIYSKDTALNVQTMNAMKYMPRLKRLDLTLRTRSYKVITDWTQLQPLNGWPQLTHLWIKLWDVPQEVIEQIVSKQYKLKILTITDVNSNIDSQWLACISRLSSLQSLTIYPFNRETNRRDNRQELRFKKSDLQTIFKRCPKMRSILITSWQWFNGEDFVVTNDSVFTKE